MNFSGTTSPHFLAYVAASEALPGSAKSDPLGSGYSMITPSTREASPSVFRATQVQILYVFTAIGVGLSGIILQSPTLLISGVVGVFAYAWVCRRHVLWRLSRCIKSRADSIVHPSAAPVYPIGLHPWTPASEYHAVFGSDDYGLLHVDAQNRRLVYEGLAYRFVVLPQHVQAIRDEMSYTTVRVHLSFRVGETVVDLETHYDTLGSAVLGYFGRRTSKRIAAEWRGALGLPDSANTDDRGCSDSEQPNAVDR